jgi:type III secretory pathway lipoprotein EscJ
MIPRNELISVDINKPDKLLKQLEHIFGVVSAKTKIIKVNANDANMTDPSPQSLIASIVHLQYWNTRIVDLCTIPEAPVFFIQQYW